MPNDIRSRLGILKKNPLTGRKDVPAPTYEKVHVRKQESPVLQLAWWRGTKLDCHSWEWRAPLDDARIITTLWSTWPKFVHWRLLSREQANLIRTFA